MSECFFKYEWVWTLVLNSDKRVQPLIISLLPQEQAPVERQKLSIVYIEKYILKTGIRTQAKSFLLLNMQVWACHVFNYVQDTDWIFGTKDFVWTVLNLISKALKILQEAHAVNLSKMLLQFSTFSRHAGQRPKAIIATLWLYEFCSRQLLLT